MKRIAIPFEGDHYPEKSLDLVRQLNEMAPLSLTAAFVPEVDYSDLWSVDGGITGTVYVPTILDEDKVIAGNSALLKRYCKEHSIRLTIHSDRLEFALPLIRREGRFSDLMILDGCHFFDNINQRQPNDYMQNILHSLESPILLLPYDAFLPRQIIFAYDGSASSVAAIKAFANLFPGLCDREVLIVHLGAKRSGFVPDQPYVEELAASYFKKFRLLQLTIGQREFESEWLPAQHRSWLVAGAYSRSEMSRFFSRSFVSDLIKKHQIPIFIAH